MTKCVIYARQSSSDEEESVSVTLHTIEGKITLPKQQIWLYRLLPHYSFRSNGKKLYYYLGKKKEIANVYGNVEKLATLGELTVYLVRWEATEIDFILIYCKYMQKGRLQVWSIF